MSDERTDAYDANPDEFQRWWDARVSAMERVLGKSHDMHGHAVIPFQFGPAMRGAADIVYFHEHLDGIVSVTSELIGRDEQIFNSLGNYELMICHRDEETWGPNIISQLAHYTLEAELNPGETMDIGPAAPDGSTIDALLFLKYATFPVRGRNCGLLLCIGITADELARCREGHRPEVEAALKRNGIYPYTDLYRMSAL
jgi:hypothetical protein